jgi:hypothetical protein
MAVKTKVAVVQFVTPLLIWHITIFSLEERKIQNKQFLDARDIVYSSHLILQQAYPQVVDGEDGLQIWVCENTEQQSQTTNKWWSVGSGKELTTANYTQSMCYKMSHSILELQGFFWNDPSNLWNYNGMTSIRFIWLRIRTSNGLL